MRVGYNLTDFIREVTFATKRQNIREVVTPIFDSDNGKCFNIDLKQKQLVPGVGMKIVLGKSGFCKSIGLYEV